MTLSNIAKGSLEVKLPTERWKKRREEEKSRREKEKVGRKEIQVREMIGKSWNSMLLQWFVGREGPKVGSLKPMKMWKNWRSRTTLGSWHVEKLDVALWREAHLQVKKLKAWRVRATFGSSDVRKLHTAVARSTFPSQNYAQSTSVSVHFWRFGCRKSVRQMR